uniref:CSON008831 protein n=1 Tax=Culicoides sonorensis TaxID=179676 RepID=A0A336MX42_CULSO
MSNNKLIFINSIFLLYIIYCNGDDLSFNVGNESSDHQLHSTAATNKVISLDGNAKSEISIINNLINKKNSVSTVTEDTSETVLPEIDDTSVFDTRPNMRESIGLQKALEWLRDKRSSDYGWGNDTHMVILAKELAGSRETSEADSHMQTIVDLEKALSEKQMEIEILNMITPHHLYPKPIDSDRLARYILALSSLCKNPRSFHGHDLVSTLQHHEPTADYEFALTALAACSSATHVRKRQIRRLLDIASDTMAMVLLALRCIVTDHRHRHLQHFVRRPARGLASLQGPRGGFGSLRSTALAMQKYRNLDTANANSLV